MFKKLFRPRHEIMGTKKGYKLVENEYGNGKGYTLIRLSDNQKLRWETLPKSAGFEAIEVVGIKHHLNEVQSSLFIRGSSILLEHEPNNPYDKNAIAVWDINHKHHIGYISKNEAPRILKKIKNNEIRQVIVMWESRNAEGKRKYVRLLLIGENAEIVY